MPIKDPQKRKEYHNRYMREVWYPKNKAKHILIVRARNRAEIRKLQEWVNSLKVAKGCIDCGNCDYRVLDFDHVTGIKTQNVAHLVRNLHSKKTILAEIAKCEVRCANCHRIITHTRRLNR